MTALDDLPESVIHVCSTFRIGLESILRKNLVGIYLYGAMTFPDSRDTIADIDYHVILRHPLDDDMRQTIDQFCRSLGRDFPPLGDELDGYYITLEDARRTASVPTQMHPLWRLPVDKAWPLHCAHIRAGQVIVLVGPDPLTIYPEPSWEDLEAALQHEMQYVEDHQTDAPAFGILNACRILYSVRTKDVVISKRGAAEWGLANLPEHWHESLRLAMRAYERPAPEEDQQVMREAMGSFIGYVKSELETLR